MSHEQIFYFVSQLKKVIIARELCFVASNYSLSIILVLLSHNLAEDFVTVDIWASVHQPHRSTWTRPLSRKLYVLFVVHKFFFSQCIFWVVFKFVHLDMLCVFFCARPCVVRSCGGKKERWKYSHAYLRYEHRQSRHMEVSHGGGHSEGQCPAGRSKSEHVRRRNAHGGTIQLLDRRRDVIISLSSAGSRGGRWVRWDHLVSVFLLSHRSFTVNVRNFYIYI